MAKKSAYAKSVLKDVKEAMLESGLDSVTVEIGESGPITLKNESGEIIEDVPEASRSQKDRWREYLGGQMLEQVIENEALKAEMRSREETLSDARNAAREQEKLVVAGEAKLTALALDLVKIERGTYTPPMFDSDGNVMATAKPSDQLGSSGPKMADPGETAGFEALGLSESFRSKLSESQLAKEVKLKTVADLERAIAADEWWHKKIKGVGKTKLDDLLDAIVAYRAEYPIPVADDGRRKQCTSFDCQQHYTKGLYVEPFFKGDPTECPVCGGNKFWHLVDPDELRPAGEPVIDEEAVPEELGEEE